MRRRDLLAGLVGLAATSGLVGCLAGGGADTPTVTSSPEPSDSGPHPVTPAEQTFDVDSRACGEGRSDAAVTFGAGSVTVDGVIGGRDTCDTAELASASLHLGVLTVVVEVVPEVPTATVACGQCLTDIDYTYRVQGLGDGPQRVEVVHRTADGERTVAVAERP